MTPESIRESQPALEATLSEVLRAVAEPEPARFGVAEGAGTGIAPVVAPLDAIAASDGRVKAFLDVLPVAAARLDRSYRYAYLNRTYLDLLRRTEAEVLGRRMSEVIGEDGFERSLPYLMRAFGGERVSFDRTATYPGIGELSFRIHYLPERAEDGAVPSVLVLAFDISEVRQTDARRLETEARFAAVYRHAGVGISMVDLEGRFVQVNPAFERMTGYAEAELIGRNIADITHPAGLNTNLALQRRLAHGEIDFYTIEKRYIRKDGQPVWAEVNVTLVRDPEGRPSLTLGVSQDITERRKAEAQLRVSLERFDVATAAANDGLWDWDLETDRVWYSARCKVLLGYDENEVGDGLAAWRAVHRDDRERVAAALDRHIADETPFDVEYRMRTKRGGYRWFHSTAKAIRDAEGKAIRLIGSTRDVTDRVLSEQKVRVLFEASSEPHLLYDSNGIIDCNAAALKWLGATDAGLIKGFHPAVLSPRLQPDGAVSLAKARELDRVAQETGLHRFEWVHRRLDGQDFVVEVTLTPTQLDGQPATLAVWHDIAERKALEATLRAAKAAADAANQSKSDFLTNMSHELRTPLNGVIGMTHLLLGSSLEAVQREWAEAVRESGENLLALVDDILDLSKLEAGRMTLYPTDFALTSLTASVIRLVSHRAKERGNTVRAALDEALPAHLRGDEMRIRQILVNLVGNAVKFTEHGTIDIRVMPCGEIDGMPGYRFEVSDTGIGMTAEVRARLFANFEQGDGSIARRYGGTGLGLAISRNLVDLLGGRIGVESELGRGSTFWFEIPLAFAKGPVPAASAGSGATFETDGGPSRKLRILVAEDNLINRRVIVDMLHRLGHDAEAVENGRLAVRAVSDGRFDLVLMDIQMPEMDGIEATKEIRALGEAGCLPIVALTANAMTGQREQYLAAGMDDYLSKPIKPAALLGLLDRVVGTIDEMLPDDATGAAEELSDDAKESQVRAEELAAIERVLGRERTRQVLETHAEDTHRRLDLIAKALAGDDLEVAANTARDLAGMLRSFGAVGAERRAKALARACGARRRDAARRFETTLRGAAMEALERMLGPYRATGPTTGEPPSDRPALPPAAAASPAPRGPDGTVETTEA